MTKLRLALAVGVSILAAAGAAAVSKTLEEELTKALNSKPGS
jgi:hypothetical protein